MTDSKAFNLTFMYILSIYY